MAAGGSGSESWDQPRGTLYVRTRMRASMLASSHDTGREGGHTTAGS